MPRDAEYMIGIFDVDRPVKIGAPVKCMVGGVVHTAYVTGCDDLETRVVVVIENLTQDSNFRYTPDLFGQVYYTIFIDRHGHDETQLWSGIGAYFRALIARGKEQHDRLPVAVLAHEVRKVHAKQLSFSALLTDECQKT